MAARVRLIVATGGTSLTVALAVVLVASVGMAPSGPGGGSSLLDMVVFLGLSVPLPVVLATMGLVIVGRAAGHPIGWLMLGAGLLLAASFAGGSYATLSTTRSGGPLPGAVVGDWVSGWAVSVGLALLGAFVPLLFPTGHPMSPAWRRLVTVLAGVVLVGTVATALLPGPLSNEPAYANPFGLPGAGDALEAIVAAFNLAAPVAFGAGLLALVVRYRRGTQSERQQIKLFAYPASIAVVAMLLSISDLAGLGDIGWTVALVALTGIPIAIAVAIVRHGLFDIDRLISRTVAYVVVTALLVAVYGLVVLASQPLVAAVTGATDLAVAAATLAVAAVFQPLRRRVQGQVDRRFDRARYDAEATVGAFAATLRTEVSLEAVGEVLVGVVRRTVQPAATALWLRGGPHAS